MGQRGRKSAAALAVVSSIADHRPAPPDELTDEQKAEWRAVVGRMPADWFPRETWGLLSAYCRHVIRARFLARELDRFEPEWLTRDDGLARFDKLAAMAERETRAVNALARSMRLTQQSRLRAETAATKAKAPMGRRPWSES